MRTARKIPFWATVFTIVSVVVLCGLGVWQIERLGWKTKILASIDREYAVDAAATPLQFSGFRKEDILRRGFLTGVFVHEKAIRLEPRVLNEQSGAHLLVPFVVSGQGVTILVNRGWVPLPKGTPLREPKGEVRIVGMIRVPEAVNSFVPLNVPEKNQWYRADMDDISAYTGISLVRDRIFYEEGQVSDSYPYPYPYPSPLTARIVLNNNHAQYVVFWFAMAIVLIVVYFFRFLRDKG